MAAEEAPGQPTVSADEGSVLRTVRNLWTYMWPEGRPDLKWRVVLAIGAMLLSKVATTLVPFAYKGVIDSLDTNGESAALVLGIAVPLVLVLAYALGNIIDAGFQQLRDVFFASVGQNAVRQLAHRTFRHLHRLSLRFHLSRRTGGLSRVIERGTKGIETIVRFTMLNTAPTMVEFVIVGTIFLFMFGVSYFGVLVVTIWLYLWFTIKASNWRIAIRRDMNESDTDANSKAVDSLLNYETVKYFGNEAFEAQEYDRHLAGWEAARMKNRLSLAALNSGQALIIAGSVTLMMFMAAGQVASGDMSLGELVMINAYMIQLFIPLNFLGFIYREIREALTNIERLFGLLGTPVKVADAPDASALEVKGGAVRFEAVSHAYNAERLILDGVTFEIPAGQTLAIVGPSGAGKSTLARLLFRFYDVSEGAIRIDGQDIRAVTQQSLRKAIGVVPQDTVLFNDTIGYNIAYGSPGASEEAIWRVLRMAQLEDFVRRLPQGLDTQVGERGLKLSGGEKQRISIARVLLKDPPILILDEATSSLDTHAERLILESLNQISRRRTTLAIAHRLSTIVHADNILVLEQGRVVEQGSHARLLELNGAYARLWANQQREGDPSP